MAFSLAMMVFLAAQVEQAAPLAKEATQPPTTREIVVTGRKLRDFRAVVRTRRKTEEPYCKLRKSSGDPALDTELCALMVNCHVAIQNSAALRLVRESGGSRQDVRRVWIAEADRCMAPFFAKHGFSED